jgi:FMN phosphatase YigB (HAD superfamily)
VPHSPVFLLDVDNTLIDNDALKAYLQAQLLSCGGQTLDVRFWETYEAVRSDLGTVSVPVTLERMRGDAAEPQVIDGLARRLFDAPFAAFVYPGALELIAWLRHRGLPVVLSDGDPWFQAKKITDSHLGAAVSGNVLVFFHKEDHAGDVRRWYPAERYIALDDKAVLLAQLKAGFDGSMTTVWVRQGHYAETRAANNSAAPDYSVASIRDARTAVEEALARAPDA